MESSQVSEPTRTYGDGLSIAFELVGSPTIFGLIGFWLDRRLGFTPFLTITFAVLSLSTVVGLVIWRYKAQMRYDEAQRHAKAATRTVPPSRWERRAMELEAELEAEMAAKEHTSAQYGAVNKSASNDAMNAIDATHSHGAEVLP